MAITYQGSIVLLSATDVSDESTAFTLTPTTETPTVMTFSGPVAAQGSTTWEGEVTVVYDNASGSAYKILIAEVASPTSGGLSTTFQPEGTATGNEEIVANCVYGYPAVEAAGDGGVQLRTFPFSVNGTPTIANQ